MTAYTVTLRNAVGREVERIVIARNGETACARACKAESKATGEGWLAVTCDYAESWIRA